MCGTVALVTGAESGIGAATARRLAVAGATVVGTAFLEDGAERLRRDAGLAAVHRLDVTDAGQWARTVAAVEHDLGPIGLLANVAGATLRGTIEETDDALWAAAIAINLTSVFLGCRAVAPGMRRIGGAIVNVASINAIRGNTALVAYSAAKAGVVGLTRSLALDLAAYGIRVNAVCPAAVDTPMTESYLASAPDRAAAAAALCAKHPLGRIATADEVAAAIVFLGGPEASFITGTALPVDGGRSAR